VSGNEKADDGFGHREPAGLSTSDSALAASKARLPTTESAMNNDKAQQLVEEFNEAIHRQDLDALAALRRTIILSSSPPTQPFPVRIRY
jgi:hypothetical protein